MTKSETVAAAAALETALRERAHGGSPPHVWALIDALKHFAATEGAPRPIRRRVETPVRRCQRCGRATTRTVCATCADSRQIR